MIKPTQIVQQLRNLGLSQNEISNLVCAEDVGCTQATISRLERGLFKSCRYDLYTALNNVLEKYKEKTTA